MPDAREQPDDEEVENPARLLYAAAAERNVHVIAKPGAQRNMPAPPKVRYGARDVGIIEVLLKVESKQPSEPDCHVGIAREVEVDLQRVAEHAVPGGQHGKSAARHAEEIVRNHAHIVGKQHLFTKADHKAPQSVGKVIRRDRTGGNLRVHGVVAHNRARDELREHCNIERQIKDALLRRRCLAVHVDGIGHNLEREKRNADGQRHPAERNQGPPRRGIDRVRNGGHILADEQYANVINDRNNEKELAVFRHHKPRHPVDENREQQHKHKHRLTPRVKQEACKQQDDVFCLNGFYERQVVENENRGKE